MRFPHKFTRANSKDWKSELAPKSEADKGRDSVFACRLHNTNGYPIQRLAVGMQSEKESSAEVQVWFWEDNSESWFLIGKDRIETSRLAYFDLPTLADGHRGTASPANPGCLEVFVQVWQMESFGEHTFVVGADVSNPGL